MKLKNSPFILLFLIIQLDGLAQSTYSTINHLDKFFIRKMQKANILGIQAAYLSNGQLEWVGSYGESNYSTHEMVNDSTLFMIASCSKPVTALGVMKLADQNKLGLDDDINDYLPFRIRNQNFPDDPISLRMLLTHTSSLKDNMDTLLSLYTFEEGGDSKMSLEEFIKGYFLPQGIYYNENDNFLNNAPGKSKVYCNVGYALAGYLIEKVSKKTFKDFMVEEIFSPLNMERSYWYLDEIPHDNISLPHEFTPNEVSQFRAMKHYGYPTVADGQLRTTVSDYAQTIKLMINGGMIEDSQFISKETIQTFLRIQFPEVDKWQAISWNYNEFDNWIYYLLMPRLPSHTGVDPGVATVTSFDPETKSGAIIFANTLTSSFKGHKILYQEMIKKLMKEARK